MMMGDMAKKLFDKLISQSLYDPSPYPDPPEEVTFEKFSAFAGEYFTPSNLILFISTPEKAGTVNEALEILYQDTAGESLPAWSEKIRMRTAPEKIEKNGMGNRSYLYWGFTRDTDPGDRAALQALSLYLSDRIVFDVREKRGMAYRMSAGIQFSGDTAAFYINMGTRPENVDRLMPDIPGFFTPEYVRDLDDNELERLISMYLGRMSFRRLSSINRGFYLSSALYFTGDHMADEKFFEQLKKVKAAEVKKAAAKYLKGGNTLTVIVR